MDAGLETACFPTRGGFLKLLFLERASFLRLGGPNEIASPAQQLYLSANSASLLFCCHLNRKKMGFQESSSVYGRVYYRTAAANSRHIT